MDYTRIACSFALSLPLVASSVAAQSIQQVILEGDVVPGMGTVTLVAGLAVDDNGGALVHVLTDNPDPNGNAAFVRAGGTVITKEGDAVAEPAGAVIRTFNAGEVKVTANGTPVFFIGIDPPVPGEEGLYFGTSPVLGILESYPATASTLPPGWSYGIILPGAINDSDDLLFYTVLDDPLVGGSFNVEALMTVATSTDVHTVRYMEGDVLPGQTFPILDFEWETLAFNNAGQAIFGANTAGPAGTNNVLYLDDTELAQLGDDSPFDLPYGNVATSTLAANLNDNGEYVFSAQISTGDGIVRNGAPFIRWADPLPAIEPFRLKEIGQPLFIGNNGRVLWMGLWKTPAPVDSRGLFADFTLLVEEGVTEVGGLVITELPGLDRSYALSPSGRYVIFEATLTGGLEGAFLIDLGA